MATRGLQALVALWLLLSIALSALILAYDGLLWADNPKTGHAYALAAFTVIDVLLLIVVLASPRLGFRASYAWGLVQLVLMLLNPLSASFIGLSVGAFASYLFGLEPVRSFGSVSCPYLCPPFAVSYDLLLIVQLLLFVSALLGWRRLRPIPPAEQKVKP
jgi:hypothetical protein